MTGVDAFLAFYRLLTRGSKIGAPFAILLTVACGALFAEMTMLIAQLLSSATSAGRPTVIPALFAACIVGFVLLSWISTSVSSSLANRALYVVADEIMRAVPMATLRQVEEVTAAGVMTGLMAERETLGIGLVRFLAVVRSGSVVASCMIFLVGEQPLTAAILIISFWLSDMLSAKHASSVRLASGRLRRMQATYRQMLGHVMIGLRSLKQHIPRRNALLRQGVLPAMRHLGVAQLVTRTRLRLQRHPRSLLMTVAALFPIVLRHFDPTIDIVPTTILSLAIAVQGFDATQAMQEMQTASVALSHIDALEQALRHEADGAVEAGFWPDRISLNDVTYTHAGPEGFELGPVTLEVHRGEILFITGGNGSGKTTLIRLLTGLYRPRSGQILCDGEELPPGGLSQLFVAVFNDFALSPAIGDISPSTELAIEDMLRRLDLDGVTKVRDGRVTAVNLSSGQRRRLALALALIEDRPYCLFDEWTADQDPEFRELFYSTLLPELRAAGRGVIVVTHDDRYFDRSDRTIKLEEGRIVSEVVA